MEPHSPDDSCLEDEEWSGEVHERLTLLKAGQSDIVEGLGAERLDAAERVQAVWARALECADLIQYQIRDDFAWFVAATSHQGGSHVRETALKALHLRAQRACDGESCCVLAFPSTGFAPLRRAIQASERPEQWKEVGTGGALDRLLAAYAGKVCSGCQAAFAEFERPQRDAICEKALVAAVASLKGSRDVASVMRRRLTRGRLAELVGDRELEELRRTRHDKRRRSAPKPIGACLPPEFAQLPGAAKSCEPASIAG